MLVIVSVYSMMLLAWSYIYLFW